MCQVGMGRVGYVPSWLCAELIMCRVVLHVNKFDEIM